jgi:hypothetical protein
VTAGPHAIVVGQSLDIAGVTPAGYNGVVTVTGVPDAFHFTYTAASGLTAATGGTATSAQAPTATVTTATESGTTVTITTTVAHGFTAGQVVTVGGVGLAGYNGTFTITSVTSNTFTYTAASGLTNSSGGSATLVSPLTGPQRSMVDSIVYSFNQAVTLGANAFTIAIHGTATITTATESGTTVTITTAAAHGFAVGQTVTVAGVGVGGYNGTFTVTAVPTTTTFTYTAASGLANSGGGTAGPGAPPAPVSYASPDGGFTWVVTFTGVTGNSIASGVYDVGLNQSAVTFNGSGATLTQNARTLDTFYRLYGDVNGTERVGSSELLAFNGTFGSRSGQATPPYVAALDFDANGRINSSDLLALNGDFGLRYRGFTATI